MSAAMTTSRTIARRFASATAILLTTIACGPPGLGSGSSSDDETDADSSTSTNTNTSTSETTDTETSGAPTTFTTNGFVPDAGESPPGCDSFQQDCPEGEKCVPYASSGGSWDATKCVPIMGGQATGEPCVSDGVAEGTDDCDGTGYCFDVMANDGEMIGTCYAFCKGSADAPECPPSSQCSISGDGTITLCIPTCDPILQDCNEGTACYWAYNDFTCIFTTQDIPIGQPCGFINDCAPGLMCVNADVVPACEAAACCSTFCELGALEDLCPALLPETACVPFFEDGMAPAEYEHVGICILPA
jgi:hypothetical protein